MSDWDNNPNAPKETAMGRFAPICATAAPNQVMQDATDLLESLKYWLGWTPDARNEWLVRHAMDIDAVIRALMERVKDLQSQVKRALDGQWNASRDAAKIPGLENRIESLEAERDIWRERAQDLQRGIGFAAIPDPTSSEIAACVAEKRKVG